MCSSDLQSYMKTSHAEFLAGVNESCTYNDEVEQGLHAALKDFKANHTW